MIIYNIFVGFAVLFEALVAWKYFETLFNRKNSALKTNISIIIGYSILYVAFIFSDFYVNSLLFTSVNFLILFYLYSSGIKECLFHSFYITVSMVSTEFLPLIVISLLFKNFLIYLQNISIGIVFILISKLLFFIIIQISLKVFNKKKDSNFTNKWFTLKLWLTPFSTIAMFVSFAYILIYNNLSDAAVTLLLVTSILILFCNIFVFSTYYQNQKINIQYTETKIRLQKIETDKQFYKMLDEQYENQNKLMHDISKHLYMIDEFINDNEIELASNYIHNIQNSKIFKTKVKFCENHTLNIILSRYYLMFKNENISPNFSILTDVNFITDEDLTSLLGNIFDNIYEATVNTKNANVELFIKYSIDDDSTVFRIINSYSKEIKISDNKLLTSKSDSYNHGYGTKIISQIVKKYSGEYNFYIDKENKKYHTFISIPNTVKQ